MEQETKITKTIDEILRDEGIILVDGSLRKESENGIGYSIYTARKYDELNLKILEETREAFLFFISLLENEKVFTIKEISEEIKALEKIINEKRRFCNENRQTEYSGRHGRITEKLKTRKEKQNTGETELKNLQELIYATRKTAERKSLLFDEKYETLFEMTWLISERIRLKKDTSYFLGFSKEDMAYESDKDERLTAGILWLSLFSDKKPALLTRDTDFVRLLGVIPKMIGSNDFGLYNEFFKKRLNENGFSLYLRTGEDSYELAIDSRNMEYEKEFKLLNIEEKESIKARERIEALWGEICE